MKWFCRIFCLYLLTLSCLPCSDGEHEHVGQTGGATTTYFTSESNSSTHEGCADTCSPFCVCHCCTTSYMVRAFSAVDFQKVVLMAEKTIFPNISFLFKDVALAIEHPPQLV